MKIQERAPILDTILDRWRASLAGDYTAYRHHCYRVLNFSLAFAGEGDVNLPKLSIASAFHDLGIWANDTYDYLDPSKQLCRAYLAETGQCEWGEEIAAMIEQHHRIRRSPADPRWLVESFRKADWVDVTKGALKFGLDAALVTEILARFPNAGFHKRLVVLTVHRLRTHPFSPLPMVRF